LGKVEVVTGVPPAPAFPLGEGEHLAE
jgi:hypothetical protein